MTKLKIVLCALLLGSQLHATANASEEQIAKKFKTQLTELCEDDAECINAVGKQFDACLKRSDFKKFVNASQANEDKYLASTLSYMYSCIVDKNGDPFFAESED